MKRVKPLVFIIETSKIKVHGWSYILGTDPDDRLANWIYGHVCIDGGLRKFGQSVIQPIGMPILWKLTP